MSHRMMSEETKKKDKITEEKKPKAVRSYDTKNRGGPRGPYQKKRKITEAKATEQAASTTTTIQAQAQAQAQAQQIIQHAHPQQHHQQHHQHHHQQQQIQQQMNFVALHQRQQLELQIMHHRHQQQHQHQQHHHQQQEQQQHNRHPLHGWLLGGGHHHVIGNHGNNDGVVAAIVGVGAKVRSNNTKSSGPYQKKRKITTEENKPKVVRSYNTKSRGPRGPYQKKNKKTTEENRKIAAKEKKLWDDKREIKKRKIAEEEKLRDDKREDKEGKKKTIPAASATATANSSRNSKRRTIKEESWDDEQWGDDNDVQLGDDNDNDIDIDDDEKPAAIKSSAFDSNRVATTTTSAIDIAPTATTTTTDKDARKIAGCRINNEEEEKEEYDSSDYDSSDDEAVERRMHKNNRANTAAGMNNTKKKKRIIMDPNKNNMNMNMNNRVGEGDDNNSTHEIRHEMTTRSRRKTRNINDRNDDSTKRNSKRFWSHKDDDHDDEEDSCNEDEEYKENNDDEEDSNDVQNHQEDNRPARKRSQPLQIKDDQVWMGRFEKLVEYKKQHTNTIVPRRYPVLGDWVATQRRNYKKDKLLPNRYALLNSINFTWKVEFHDQIWMGMFEKLVEYKKQHKNTLVPRRYPVLGGWVADQRRNYKKDKLLPNRYALLNSVNFTWKVESHDQIWMGMFEKLVQYKKQHTNTIVPSKTKLGYWVSCQRKAYKNDELSPKRLALLNSVGFKLVGYKGGKVDVLRRY